MNAKGAALDRRLLEAHARDDLTALIALYSEAADLREAVGDVDGACFYLTHAFVFSLQAGDGVAQELQRRLWQHGREVCPE